MRCCVDQNNSDGIREEDETDGREWLIKLNYFSQVHFTKVYMKSSRIKVGNGHAH